MRNVTSIVQPAGLNSHREPLARSALATPVSLQSCPRTLAQVAFLCLEYSVPASVPAWLLPTSTPRLTRRQEAFSGLSPDQTTLLKCSFYQGFLFRLGTCQRFPVIKEQLLLAARRVCM